MFVNSGCKLTDVPWWTRLHVAWLRPVPDSSSLRIMSAAMQCAQNMSQVQTETAAARSLPACQAYIYSEGIKGGRETTQTFNSAFAAADLAGVSGNMM